VTLRIAGQTIPCGKLFAVETLKVPMGTLGAGGDKELTADIGTLDAQIKEAEIVLTPNPKAVEEYPYVDRIWGKEIILNHVPLSRQDLYGAKPVKATTSPAPKLAFGPVMERVIQARQTGTNSFLNLETGALLMPPAEVVNSLPPVNADDQTRRYWQGLDIPANSRPQRYLAWLAENGVDLMFDDSGGVLAFAGVWAVAHGTNSATWDDWDGLTPEMAHVALAKIEEATRTTQSGETTVSEYNGPIYTSAKRLYSRSAGPAVWELNREQSVTWFFKTREGGTGLLQVTGFTENPRGVKLRYRLVKFASGRFRG
jgi:hypothetical protein